MQHKNFFTGLSAETIKKSILANITDFATYLSVNSKQTNY